MAGARKKRPKRFKPKSQRRAENRRRSDEDAEAARAEFQRIENERQIEHQQSESKKMGRPELYSDELADLLLARIASTPAGLRTICAADDMPGIVTVMKWLREKPDFSIRYARAKDEQADLLAEDALDVSNTPEIGHKTEISQFGQKVISGDMIEHRRLKVETRKWLAAKLKPKKYGNRLNVAGVPGSPLGVDADAMSDEELARVAAQGKPDEGVY